MTKIAARKAKQDFDETLQRVKEDHQRVLVVRGGRPLAAIVPVEDLELLEKLEDRVDLEEIRRRIADPNDEELPYEEVRQALGLD